MLRRRGPENQNEWGRRMRDNGRGYDRRVFAGDPPARVRGIMTSPSVSLVLVSTVLRGNTSCRTVEEDPPTGRVSGTRHTQQEK